MSRETFWSRRRAAVRAEEVAEADAESRARIEDERAELAEKPDAEILAELGLPDPDTISAGDDVRAFMARAVPLHLRRRALRRLWVSNPALACLDGLVDYAEDYTDAARVVPDLRTAFRVGAGMVSQVEGLAAARERVAPPDEGPADRDEPAAALTPEPVAPQADADAAMPQTDPTGPRAEPDQPEDMAAPPLPRRMAFRFDGGGA